MKNGKRPDPATRFPIPGCDTVVSGKGTVKNPAIEVGEFTYFGDPDWETRVTHLYPFNGDRLRIGKFCQIAAGVEFVMNGANHQMNAASTYPFYVMEGWDQYVPPKTEMPLRGDTVIGNDVWIGQNATILPGVHIGDGAIIGLGSVVGSDVAPYTVVAGNPAKPIRKRFDDDLVSLLEEFCWWDLPVDEINALLPVLTSSDLEQTKRTLRAMLAAKG